MIEPSSHVDSTAPAAGDALVYARNTRGLAAGEPILASDVTPGTGLQAFPLGKPHGRSTLIEVVRLGSSDNPGPIVAFSAVCTHLGCSVEPDLDEQGRIVCPCRGSRFDPAQRDAVSHGPERTPLLEVAISLVPDGSLVAGASRIPSR